DSAPATLLTDREYTGLVELSNRVRTDSVVTMATDELDASPTLRMFLDLLRVFGAVRVDTQAESVVIQPAGPLAKDMPYSLVAAMRSRSVLFEDWSKRHKSAPDRLSALEFLHHLELQRIASSVAHGVSPEVWVHRPVAFAV